MTSAARGKVLIVGAAIAFIAFVLPGLYGVAYAPPAGTPYASIRIDALAGFGGGLSGATGGVYNGFQGPFDFQKTLWVIIVLLLQGLLAQRIDFDTAGTLIRRIFYWVIPLGTAVLALGQFVWAFRYDHLPQAVTDRFISDLGGGQQAIAASQYLHGELGASTLLLGLGLIVAYYGVKARTGLLITLIVFVAALLARAGVLG